MVSPQELRSAQTRTYARAEFSAGWLTFQSATEARRLASFPRNWELLSDDELSQLLRFARPVQRTRQSLDETSPSRERAAGA